MPFADFDRAAIARALAQVADRDGDLVDAYFERLEEIELPPDGEPPGLRSRREEGFAVRLVRDGASWLAGRDGIDGESFGEALRQVARVLPSTAYPNPEMSPAPWPEPPSAPELAELPSRVQRAIRERHVAFPLRLTVRRHRRLLQVLGPRLVADPERESFYSVAAELPWGGWGTLLPALEQDTPERIADTLVAFFRARHAAPPEPCRGVVVLGPAAAAVLLHEAVAHALEVDTLARGGDPAAAVGVAMAAPLLSILDDPGTAPEPVRRVTDDEGVAVVRRWLLRDGVVSQPLADSVWAAGSELLAPGAARRASRHDPPGPRSTHLEMPPGACSEQELLADAEGGLLIPEARRGGLDAISGAFFLEAPFAHRIRCGTAADPVGPCRLTGAVADVLTRVTATGAEIRTAGAGWCAKGGRRMPVWATVPALRFEGVEVAP